MPTYFKFIRARARISAQSAADALGVPLGTYLLIEKGSLPVPAKYLSRLAELLGTEPEALQGNTELFDYSCLLELPYARTYFGEVAFHFSSGGAPLLASISWADKINITAALNNNRAFIQFTTLQNQTIFVRHSAVTDVFLSDNSCDTYGPEEEIYNAPVMLEPNPLFWETAGELLGAFIEKEHGDDEFRRLLEPKESDFNTDIAGRTLNEQEKLAALLQAQEEASKIFSYATRVHWQMGTQRRCQLIDDNTRMYESVKHLESAKLSKLMSLKPVCFTTDEDQCDVHISPRALDYIAFPTHKYNIEVIEHLDELESPKTSKWQESILDGQGV